MTQNNKFFDCVKEEWLKIKPKIETLFKEQWDDPELPGMEIKSYSRLANWLEENNFQVTHSPYNIPTAFIADSDPKVKGPTICILAEYDALPGIGHACGHNIISSIGLGAMYLLSKNKNKLKTTHQYISIVYANLFQQALSANELVEISRCIESIGDKQVAHEIVLSNFMNKEGVIIPSDSVMREDLDLFIEETYKRFYVRDITEAEREFFINFFENNQNVSAEMVYMAFALSNEYQYY